MARPLRIEFPGALYHVTSRGHARAAIYADDTDRTTFLALLAQVVPRYHWLCHAYCLMDNHYHLVLETPEGNLSQGMRQVNGLYTQRYNRRHGHVGHVLQGRYKALLIEPDRYLLTVCRYVVLHLVRAGMAQTAQVYDRAATAPRHIAIPLACLITRYGTVLSSCYLPTEEATDPFAPRWIQRYMQHTSPLCDEGLRYMAIDSTPQVTALQAQATARLFLSEHLPDRLTVVYRKTMRNPSWVKWWSFVSTSGSPSRRITCMEWQSVRLYYLPGRAA